MEANKYVNSTRTVMYELESEYKYITSVKEINWELQA